MTGKEKVDKTRKHRSAIILCGRNRIAAAEPKQIKAVEKEHLSSEPDVVTESIDDQTEFLILASDGIWKVMSNEDAVKCVRGIKDPRTAAKHLNVEAISRKTTDDVSTVVVRSSSSSSPMASLTFFVVSFAASHASSIVCFAFSPNSIPVSIAVAAPSLILSATDDLLSSLRASSMPVSAVAVPFALRAVSIYCLQANNN
nr:probable protein phosphatase 2C 39 [Ipomoea batatas]